MSGRITIVLIESSFLIRSGIENLLKELQGLYLTEVFDGSEKHLIEKINALKPDCIILNPEMIKDFLNSFVLSLNNEATLIGLISNDTPSQIKSRFKYTLNIKDGKHELITNMNNIVGLRKSKSIITTENQSLSKREITILKHITLGLTNQEVAEKLFLSVHTVMTHRKNITKKLGIKTVSGLTVYALLNKIIEIQDIDQ